MSKITNFTADQLNSWKENGFLIVRAKDFLSAQEVKNVIQWVSEVEEYPEVPGKWMKYFEKSLIDDSRILNRVENFFPFHEGLNSLCNTKPMLNLVSQLFDEQAVLYKEKINFKYSGGGDFKPHQDAQARWDRYGHTIHLTAMISVDATTVKNGCLELVSGEHKKGLVGPMDGPIPDSVVKGFNWISCPTEPGDIVLFDSFVPHRSGPNLSKDRRRVLYVTYNKLSEGDFREKYYADKRLSFPPDCEREPGKNYEYKI